MTLGQHARVVAASVLGAVAVVAAVAVPLVLSPGVSEGWILRQIPITVGTALVFGVIVAAALAYFDAEPATVSRVTRRLPRVTAPLTTVILLYRFVQAFASQG